MKTCRTLCLFGARRLLHSVAALRSPMAGRPRGLPSAAAIRRTIIHVYIAVLLLSNALLLYVGGELVDLYVSSVELWAELARKHLELTL